MPKIFALVVVLVAGLGPAEEPEYVPAGNRAYTTDLELDGYRNGKMDPARMMTVQGCTLERDAAYLYSLMLDAARKDGINLTHDNCYRTLEAQVQIYERTCPYVNKPVYGVDAETGEQVQLAMRRVRECSGPPAAIPGTSNHGWGRAVDFNGRGSRIMSCYDKEFKWLQANAYRFGWIHPAWAHCGRDTEEAWHWEYAGVTDPTLVPYVDPYPTTVLPELE